MHPCELHAHAGELSVQTAQIPCLESVPFLLILRFSYRGLNTFYFAVFSFLNANMTGTKMRATNPDANPLV